MVKSGLSPREFIEQSSCFVFQDGWVMTFNDEIACRAKIGMEITGAVQATSLLEILQKLTDEELRVRENEDGELEFRGKGKGFGVTKQKEVFLPIERVEIPKKWADVPKGFMKSIDLVKHCVSADESRFMLTCIHIHPEFVEACDNLQIMRCAVKTGLEKDVLVRGSSLQDLIGLGPSEMAQTKNWIHFRNKKGLIFSCRQWEESYPELDDMIKFKGHAIVLPKSVSDATERAAVFASDRAGDPLVRVKLSEGVIRLEGKGITGWYKEDRNVDYSGPDLEFLVAPKLLIHICENYAAAQITDEKLKATGTDEATGHGWQYVTVLGPPDEQAPAPDADEDEKPQDD